MEMNVYLIGYRCSGKTTLGKALSRCMQRPFIDTDDEIVHANGMTIQQMVAEKGWAFFRRQERRVIETACRHRKTVVATGGGAVLDSRNVADLRASGTVVWLRSRPQTIKKWILADPASETQRPALTSEAVFDEIDATLAERTPLYQAAMHFAVDTDDFNVPALVQEIMQKLKGMGIE
jgi:shikimate kinase